MNIKEIKEKYTCLDYLSERVIRKTASGYLARAPWRDDHHPSLTITPNGKGWHDLSSGAHGSVIDLVMLDLKCDIASACEELECRNPSFSLPQPSLENDGGREKETFSRFDVVPLQSRGLFAYLHQRGINIEIAKRFLVEAHYSTRQPDDGTYIYTLGYSNDNGGYELRNAFRKLSKAPKTITTHHLIENAPTVVFEGFFDMLSFATLCGEIRHNYLTLNSIVNADAAIDELRNTNGQVYLCLDNDKGGDDATAKMLDALPSAIDIRSRFAPAKDLNAYLILKNKEK